MSLCCRSLLEVKVSVYLHPQKGYVISWFKPGSISLGFSSRPLQPQSRTPRRAHNLRKVGLTHTTQSLIYSWCFGDKILKQYVIHLLVQLNTISAPSLAYGAGVAQFQHHIYAIRQHSLLAEPPESFTKLSKSFKVEGHVGGAKTAYDCWYFLRGLSQQSCQPTRSLTKQRAILSDPRAT